MAEGSAPTPTRARREKARPRAPRTSKNRRDIQALRAIAVLAVVVYHAWPDILPGGYIGVDIFFVISGFLITSHLIAHPPRKLADFARFWARRAIRLMPPVLVVLVAVLGLTWLIAPQLVWKDTAKDAVFSAVYVQNWRLISESTQYLDARGTPSPMQHFWSLSVEEQYYLVWPVVVALLAWGAAHLARRRFAIGFALVTVVSFGYGIYLTQADPSAAYFSTFARLWELSLGSTLAALAPMIAGCLRERKIIAIGVQVLGLAGIAVSLALITDQVPFPGAIALLPTASCALVIAAGDPRGTGPLRAVLHSPPAQWFGNVSYSLYLWHWPLLILGTFAFGEPLTLIETIGLVLLGFVLAGLSTQFVENPARRSPFLLSRPRYGLLLAVVSAMVVSVAAFGLFMAARHAQQQASERVETAITEQECIGAAAMDTELDCAGPSELITAPEFAKEDVPAGISSCLNWPPFSDLVSCRIGDPNGDKKIAMIGNSHIGQWTPTFDTLDGGCQGVQYVADGIIGATSQQYLIDMADLGVDAIVDLVRDGIKPETSEGLDFFNTGVKLVTDSPVDGLESIDSTQAAEICWG